MNRKHNSLIPQTHSSHPTCVNLLLVKENSGSFLRSGASFISKTNQFLNNRLVLNLSGRIFKLLIVNPLIIKQIDVQKHTKLG